MLYFCFISIFLCKTNCIQTSTRKYNFKNKAHYLLGLLFWKTRCIPIFLLQPVSVSHFSLVCCKPAGCWRNDVKLILLFAKWNCLLHESIQSKHSSRELIFLSLRLKKMRKRRYDCWWICVTSLVGRRRVCVSVGRGRGGRVCCHFLLGSVLYVCALAWTPVRSFLMISFTVKQRKRGT